MKQDKKQLSKKIQDWLDTDIDFSFLRRRDLFNIIHQFKKIVEEDVK